MSRRIDRSGGVSTVTIPLVAPGTLYGERRNQIDIRVARNFRFGNKRLQLLWDLYNVMNSNPVLTYNNAFIPNGNWLVPTSVLQSRFVKLSASIDF